MARLVLSAAVATVAFVASGYNPAVAAQAFTITYGKAPALEPKSKEDHDDTECLDQT